MQRLQAAGTREEEAQAATKGRAVMPTSVWRVVEGWVEEEVAGGGGLAD